MRRRPLIWFAISLLCFAGALYFWRLGNEWAARKQTTPSAPGEQSSQTSSHSIVSASTAPLALLSQPQPTAARATNWLAYRFKNTSRSAGQLLRDDRAVLLENALIDTSRPLGFSIPDHLRAAGDPGSYIVQARGAVDDRFRAALSAAGAKIISYIPNNAYLVRVSEGGAQQMSANPLTQMVLPYEPAYKLKTELFKLAMETQPLPEGTALNVVVFEDAREQTLAEFAQRGVEVLAESRSPFGPALTVRFPSTEGSGVGWSELARLPGVELLELSRPRVPANDLSRVRLGVATDTQTQTNYLNLSGSNVVVNLNDTGVSANHPDLTGRILFDVPTSGVDSNGHGTHVAGIIAGDGTKSITVTNARGSINPGTNFQYRGKAPAAKIFSIGTGLGGPFPSDAYMQERAAQTNALISNNSWSYGGDNTYNIGAASFDAATRDALPQVTGSQPLLFVFGAGNVGPPRSGDDSGQGGDPETILSPATAKNVITVGAIEQPRDITNEVWKCSPCATCTNGTSCTTNQPWKGMTSSATEVAAFSARGNVGIGIEGDFGRYKPDLMAPGTFVISTRSLEWDEGAYYNPTSHIVDVLDVTILTNRSFTNLISIPNNAVAFTIVLARNQNSPSPLPDLPIFVRQDAPPGPGDSVAMNSITVPPGGNPPVSLVVGTTWYYVVANITTQNISLAIVTDIVVTNELGNYFEVLSNLNNSISGTAPHYYRYESGTSMSAADVSGVLALMQEFFEQRLPSLGIPAMTISPALYKALLINGARSLPSPYDFQVEKSTANFQGWGLVNLPNSLPVSITNGITHVGAASMEIFDQSPTNALATGQRQTRLVSTSDLARNNLPLRITLVWTDPPGNPTAGVKLVNDLDLIVTNLDTGEVFLGNDIGQSSNFTFPWNTNGPPNADAINNVENVYLIPPLGSNYAVTVLARHVNVNAVTAHTNGTVQDYALVISAGDGEVPDALTMGTAQPIVGTNELTVGYITNSFLNNQFFSGSLLTGQRVGANTPLLGTTNGMINQWHFYVITNTSTFTNAAFVTFLPPTLSIPRMGVFDPDPDNATRVEADIDLYVSLNPGLTNLDPAVIASCVAGIGNDHASRGRGGTEFVVYSNSVSDQIYYVGVKSEDQMAAEYTFLGIFSLNPFSQRDTNGNLIVLGLPVPSVVPDGNPANPGVATVLGLAIEPISVRRVVVTNWFYHENPGDLVGTLVHDQKFAVLNNHRGGLPGFYTFIYEDNGEGDVPFAQHTDGPGNLRDFVGESGFGVWMLAMLDNADANTGRVDLLTLQLEPQNVNSNGTTRAVQPNTFTYDFINVPAGATNLTVCVAGNTLPVELYVLRGDFPSRTVFDYANTNVPPGGDCLTVTPFDVPPLLPGRYYIGVFNPNGVVQNIRIFASVILNPASIASSVSSTVGPVSILDDAVTYASFNVTNHLLISDLDVGLLIQHQRISDLAITLISPRGTRILLFEDRGMASSNGLGTFSIATNGLGAVGLEVTNTLWFYTNGFEAAPVGLYAPGAVFEGWHVLTNMVAVLPDFSDLCGTNKLLVLGDGVVSNTLPTTNSTSFNLSFQVTHAPYLVGMVSWWPLDGDPRDIFGGLDGLLCCNVQFAQGKVGSAYYGDGIATSMTVPRCAELNVGKGRGFSIEGWVRPANITNAAPLVEWSDRTNVNQQGVQFWLGNPFLTNAGPGSLAAVVWDTNSLPHLIQTGPFTLTNALPNSPTNSLTNGWQHVALTFEAGTGATRLYVNGQPAAFQLLGNFVPKTWGDVFIGYHPTGTNIGTAFAGGLDEFSVYERALSDCEVAAIFKANYRGKYGTNVLTCPVALQVTLANAVGTITSIFTNGLGWTNGPYWETDTITNFTDLPGFTTNGFATNFTSITVRPLDPNVAVDNFALSAFVTNILSGLLHFTEDTNLAVSPIKFAAAPYTMTNFPPTLIFSNDFENATQGVYTAGAVLPGSANAPAVGVRDWTVVAGPLTVISNASSDVVGTNWMALAGGAVQCALPTIPGHRYELSYTVRGPCAVGWWPGDIEPLSDRAQDLISGNHGAFINTATNTGAGFVVTRRGANALYFAGMIDATNHIATKIELGDPPQLRLTNAFTIEGWVRPQQQTNSYILSLLSSSEEAVIEQILFRGDSRRCRDPYWLALEQAAANQWHILFHVEGPNSPSCGITAELGDPGIDDNWHHIAAVFERNVAWTDNPPWPTNQIRLYVDGLRVTNLLTEPFEDAPFDGFTGENPFAELDPAFSSGVAIGNRSRYDNSQPFRGNIDELTVYSRALTDPEIAAIAVGGRGGKADLVVPPDHSLAKVSVSLDNVLTDVGYGDNAEWTTRRFVFTARGTNMVLKLESNLPGTLVDAVTLSELPAELNFLPEESLAALNGEDAFGTWRLEIWDTRAGATNINPQLLQWQLNFRLVPQNPLPTIYLSHGIPYSGALPANGVQYFVVDIPQWAVWATNVLQGSSQPVTVLFNQTNFPAPGDQVLIGPGVTGTRVLTTNTTPPLVIGQPYYLAVTNVNAFPVTFSLGVWFDIITLANCQPLTNFVGLAGIPHYFQFDVPTNSAPPREATFLLSGAQTNVAVVLSQHLPLPDLAHADYISQQPCTNDEVFVVLTNTTPFPLQTNRWYAGVFNTAPTNVLFTVEACYSVTNPILIPLTNGVPYVAALTNQFVAPPGPPRSFFFTFEITNFVDAVLFELYGLSGDADLVVQRDVPPGMAPYLDRSFRTEKTPDQIVLRIGPDFPDLRGKWYLGVDNNEFTNKVAYTIRATVPAGGILASAQPIVVTNNLFGCSRLLSWNSVEGERYFIQFAPDGVNWTTLGSMTATTPCATFVASVPCLSPFTPVSWWPAEGNAIDVADGNNGTLVGNTAYAPGEVCQGFVFDGNLDGVLVGNPANLQLQNFTIEAWIKRSSSSVVTLSSTPLWAEFVCYGTGGYALGILSSGQIFLSKVDIDQTQTPVGIGITDTNWHHAAVTKSGNVVVFYLDGTAYPVTPYNTTYTFTSPMGIGVRGDNLTSSFYGRIDELAIFNRALTASEIRGIYMAGSNGKCAACTSAPVGQISWWHADGDANDSVDGNNGILSSGMAFVPGKVGCSAFGFNGTNADVRVPAATNLDVGLGGGFTIETWVNPADLTSARPLVEWSDGANYGVHLWLFAWPNDTDGSALYLNVLDTALGNHGIFTAPGTITTNAYQHVAATYNKINGVAALYINGALIIQQNLGVVAPRTIGDLYFGFRPAGPGAGARYVGAMDEVSIYNRPLTTAEIQSIYNGGQGVRCGASACNFRVIQVPQFSSIPLPVYQPFTNSVGPGLITTFIVEVPSWASFATNSLVFASAPVNLWFNQLVRPTGAGSDINLLNNSVAGVVTLTTNGTPPLLPSQRYYLGVENLSAVPINFALQVDFNFTQLSNNVPVRSVADSPALPRYFYFDVSTNATAVAFQLFNLTGDANLVVRKTIPPLPIPFNNDYGSFNGGNLREDIIIFTNSTPVPLSSGRWFAGVFDANPTPVAYTIRAIEFTNLFPPIITLTNAIPYFNTNSGAGNATDYYRFVVSTNAVRAQFEINGPSADMTLVARKGLPLPGLASFDYISANPSTNDELIVVFTNSTPVPLSAGDWFLSTVNVSGGSVSYAIKATEWPLTGQPIIITNSAVITNSFCLTWTSLPGVHYHVDGLTSLNSTNWVTVSPTITATDVLTTWCIPLPSPYHFFRVVEGLALNALAPPSATTITSITRTASSVQLQWSGPASGTYQVQWTPTLTPPAWTTFTGNVTSPTGQFKFLDDGSQTGGLGSTRFYRLLKL